MTEEVPRKEEEAMFDNEARYRAIFENSPVELLEEDFSGVKKYLNEKMSSGVKNLRAFFAKHPEELLKCADLVKILDVNNAAIKLLGASSKEKALRGISQWYVKESYLRLMEEIIAISEGKTSFEAEGINMRLDGEMIYTLLKWNVVPGCELDLCRTLVSLTDISERNKMWDALKSSEEKYHTIFETAANFIVSISREGLIVDSNNRVREFLGYSPEEIIGQSMAKIFHQDYLEKAQKSLKEIMNKGSLNNEEYRMVHKDGTIIDVNINSSALKNKAGRYDRCLCLVEDITRRKKAQDSLIWELAVNTSIAKLLKPLLSTSSNISIMTSSILAQAKFITGSEHGYVTIIDPETGDNVGHAQTEMMERGMCQTSEGGSLPRFHRGPDGLYDALWGYALNTRIPFYTNSPSSHISSRGTPQGHIALTRFLSVPVVIGEELVGQIALANSHRDYTERDLEAIIRMGELYALALRRLRMESALQESEDKYRRLVESSTDGVVIQQEGKVAYINPAGAKILGGKKPAELLGKEIPAFLHPDYIALLEESARTLTKVSQPILEREMTRMDGKTIYIEVTALPFTYKSKPALQVIFRDITERKRIEGELTRSKAKYQQLVELAYDGIGVCDTGYNITFVNQRLAEMLGYPVGEMMGKSIFDFFDKDGQKAARSYAERRKQGLSEQHDLEFIRKDGTRMHALVNASPLADEQGHFSGILLIIADITERKKMEEDLRNENEKLELITKNMGVGVAIILRDRKVVWANSVLKDLFGNIEGKCCYSAMHQLDDACSDCGITKVFRGKSMHTLEQASIDAKGEKVWSQIITTPIKNSKGDVIFALEIVIPITSRRKMEEALRESEEKYRELVESANSIIFKWDLKGNVLSFNEFAERFFGFSREEVVGKNLYETIIPKTESSGRDISNLVQLIVSDEKYSTNVNENVKKSGERVWIHWTNKPLRNKDEEVIAVLSVGTDISDRMRDEERLRLAHQQLQDIIDFLPDATMVMDKEGVVIAWNKAIEEMTGVRKEAMIGKGNYEYSLPFYGLRRPGLIDLVMHPDQGIEKMYKAIQKEGNTFYTETLVRLRGAKRCLWATASQLFDDDGNVVGAIESIRDITERKRIEDALLASEEKYRSLYENIPDGIYQSTAEGKLITVNQALVDILGYGSKEELLNANIADDLYANPGERRSAIEKLNQDGEIRTSDLVLKRKDGKQIHVLENAHIVKDHGGRILYYEGTLTDITERKRMEDALKLFSEHLADLVDDRAAKLQVSEERFRRIIEASPDAMMVVEDDGTITECNQAALDLLKLEGKENLLGRNYLDFIITRDKPLAVGSMTNTYVSGLMKDLEFSVLTKYRDEIPVSISSGLIQESSSKLGSVVLIIKDITQRKMAEAELKRVMEMREQFISNITHELRTPLVAMMGYLDYILSGKMGEVPEKIGENLGIVKRNTDRLISLTNDILDVKRIEAGKIQLELEKIDVREIIKCCRNELEPFLIEKQQVFELLGKEAPLIIEGDRIKLTQVLTNLLSNASKFTPEHGKISIETYDDGATVRIIVSDTGIGIKSEDLERVFEPFTAIKKTSYVRGTGLGLSVTRGLVEAHGGKIWAESAGEGMGARLIFVLPKEVVTTGGSGSVRKNTSG